MFAKSPQLEVVAFNRREYRLIRAVPVSMTARTPGTVIDVSATLVASTIRRPG